MPSNEGALQAADAWIDDWYARAQARTSATSALLHGFSGISGSSDAGGGRIQVTVDAAGALTSLYLDDDLRQQPVSRTAAQVLDAIGDACADLVRAARAVPHTVPSAGPFGPESQTAQALVAGVEARSSVRSDPASLVLVTADEVAQARFLPSGRIVDLEFAEEFRSQPTGDTAHELLALTVRVRSRAGS